MMSLQWGIVAGFLYFEIGVVVLLLLPFISAQRWLKIFRSRILHSLGAQTQLYFYGLFGLLCLLFLDAIREMRKYSNEEYDLTVNPKAEMQAHMKLFRAQRNFYISGFALFFSLIIRRLVSLISIQATLHAQTEAALKQASSASDAARRLMNDGDKKNANDKESSAKVATLETEVNTLKEELEKLTKDRNAVKSQAASVSKEYDRLTDEYAKLQKKLSTSGGDKKAD
ncbi:B-cell receptor-associated protein 31 [Folsomia candida]|uniref:Endoplasmic reticulum transmembrane protein n=1 Tax=Folsomia candida TaxID=158441 RepID=A0A226DPC6_FOLCA|nr:B-cell receptor-associated protein 31 [Folsomia candida]OXA46471.1 B-cell receptor-associated protein 31 [Folsomia candida]QBH73430.1 bcr-associated protein [Folsomia candida]